MTGLPLLLMLIFGAVKARRPFFLVNEPSLVLSGFVFVFQDLMIWQPTTWWHGKTVQKEINKHRENTENPWTFTSVSMIFYLIIQKRRGGPFPHQSPPLMNDFSKRLLNPNDCGGDIGELDLAQPPLHLKWWDVLVRCKRTRETVFFSYPDT